MTIPCYPTQYGFHYGSADVARFSSDEKKGWVIIGIRTQKHPNGVQVYVTKMGKTRVFMDGKELK